MDTKKINIDGKDIEYVTDISKEEIENNNDLFKNELNNDDTLDLSELPKIIESRDTNE